MCHKILCSCVFICVRSASVIKFREVSVIIIIIWLSRQANVGLAFFIVHILILLGYSFSMWGNVLVIGLM